MPNNQIIYPSGSTLTRKMGNGYEIWEFDNKSLKNAMFTINLSECENITFEDGSYEDPKTAKIPYLKKKDIFKLMKGSSYLFAPRFSLNEEPIPLKKQKKHTEDERNKIELIIDHIEEVFKTLPFEVMPEKELQKAIKKNDIDHFVDPHFPPRDTSIHNFTEAYPYDDIVHWRRPHEFMRNPKIFEDDIDPNDIKQGFLPD